MKKIFLTLICLVSLVLTSNLQAQTQQWAAVYNNGARDIFEKMVIDNSGNVFVTGERYVTTTSNPQQYLAKYNASGMFQWQRFFYGPYSETFAHRGTVSLTSGVDNSGNVYIAGYTDSAVSFTKGYLMKYSPNGDSLWCRYAGINDTIGYAAWYSMKLDNAGNIYLGGFFFNRDVSKKGFLVAKYNSSGVPQWIKAHRPSSFYNTSQIGYTLQLDNSDNVYIAATLQKSSFSSSNDFYVLKLNNSGIFQWETLYNGPADGSDRVSSMTLDMSGNIYVEGLRTNIPPAIEEIACVKFNGSNGAFQWAFGTSGTGGMWEAEAYNIAAGISNDIYLTGLLHYSTDNINGVLIKLNSSTGTEMWRKNMSSGQAFNANMYTDVKVIYSGIIYAVGVLNYYTTSSSVIIKKFNAAGDSLAGATYTQSNYIIPRALVPGPGNSLFIGGDNTYGSPACDVFIVKYDVTTGIEPVSGITPDKFLLSQNYPNPFNPETKINFQLAGDAKVSLQIYDISGKLVMSLINNENYSAGYYTAQFNASQLSSGTYFYKLTAGEFVQTKKMQLIK